MNPGRADEKTRVPRLHHTPVSESHLFRSHARIDDHVEELVQSGERESQLDHGEMFADAISRTGAEWARHVLHVRRGVEPSFGPAHIWF